MALRTKKSRSNSVSWLSDDEVALILNRVTHPDDRKSFSEVCKQWCRVEGLNRSSIRLLRLDFLLRVLPRFPNLVTFETSKCITRNDLEFLFQTCPKIEAINLGKPASDDVIEPWDYGSEVLYPLTYSCPACPKLSKVSLRRRDYIGGAIPLIKAQNNLRHLDLGHCSCVFDKVLEAIGSLSLLNYLNLECCDRIMDSGLGFLANGSCSKPSRHWCLLGAV